MSRNPKRRLLPAVSKQFEPTMCFRLSVHDVFVAEVHSYVLFLTVFNAKKYNSYVEKHLA